MKRGSEFVFGGDLQKPQEQDPVVRGVGVLSGLVVRACEVKVLVSQWCPTLCNPMDSRIFCPQTSPGRNTEEGCHSLFQGIFQTQGSSMGVLYCRQILYHLSHSMEGENLPISQLPRTQACGKKPRRPHSPFSLSQEDHEINTQAHPPRPQISPDPQGTNTCNWCRAREYLLKNTVPTRN